MYGQPVDTKIVTADGALRTYNAGEGERVFNLHILSAGTASPVSLYNGSPAGTLYIKETGTANTGKTIDFGVNGIWFPLGCYIDVDPTNIVSVAVQCRKDIS